MNNRIWLPDGKYPEKQTTKYSSLSGSGELNYTVCEFRRTYGFKGKQAKSVRVEVSGDTAFILFDGERQLLRGPAWVGGDFLFNDESRPEYYAYEFEFAPEHPGVISFSALVRMGSVRICEYSRGAGGFFLEGTVYFSDRTEERISSDESWLVRYIGAYTEPYRFSGGILPDSFVPTEPKRSDVTLITAPIPPCDENTLPLPGNGVIHVDSAGTYIKDFELPKIYACYLNVYCESHFPVDVCVTGYELRGNQDWKAELHFNGNGVYRGMELQSVGGIIVKVRTDSDEPVCIRIELRAAHYPAPLLAKTVTSDEDLNAVFDTCVHSLKYCRQSIHLDSPRHCEPLACTGDYYIETLMTAFTFGDMRLAEFDIHRTAELLRHHDGRMFHTSYSLIWVQMLRDVYMLTGNHTLLEENEDALRLLLERFNSYIGKNGLIEYSPDYMFIDWLNPDGINLHHPPKALGQTCLCMYYFGALKTAESIYSALGDGSRSGVIRERRDSLRESVLSFLWDDKRGLFFEGLNTPTPAELVGEWLPQNIEKRYYRKHANILAAYFGFFDKEKNREVLRRIIDDDSLGEVQPYFQHFLLDAIYRNGLRDEYTLRLLDQWKPFVKECPKGLPEGFYKPTPGYCFDRSHAWGGTPAYALPLAVAGLEILEPGFKKIRLSPSCLGLDRVTARVPTPYGVITVTTGKGIRDEITVPAEIQVIIEGEEKCQNTL
ncbi:MAG: hypothetical protein K6G90_11660 [Clostridia bacterium]|nr:hypothetical protein [Clostridia bacterium]